MTEVQNEEPSSEGDAERARKQGSILRGVSSLLITIGMTNEKFGSEDLSKLAQDFSGLATRIDTERKPLPETDLTGGRMATIIKQSDLQPPLKP